MILREKSEKSVTIIIKHNRLDKQSIRSNKGMGNLASAKGLPGRPVDLPNIVQNNKQHSHNSYIITKVIFEKSCT